jgi:hypothetical protein
VTSNSNDVDRIRSRSRQRVDIAIGTKRIGHGYHCFLVAEAAFRVPEYSVKLVEVFHHSQLVRLTSPGCKDRKVGGSHFIVLVVSDEFEEQRIQQRTTLVILLGFLVLRSKCLCICSSYLGVFVSHKGSDCRLNVTDVHVFKAWQFRRLQCLDKCSGFKKCIPGERACC